MLGILLFIYIGLIIVTALLIAGMYLIKNQKLTNVIFCSLAVFNMFLIAISVASYPTNFQIEKMMTGMISVFLIPAFVIFVTQKEKRLLAKHFLTLTSVLLFIDLFI